MAATHTKDLNTFDLPCWVYKPDGFDAAAVDHYPVLIFLHGSGVTGSGIDSIITLDAPTPASEANNKLNTPDFAHNFIILSPYKDSGDWFPNPLELLMQSIIDNKDIIKADITKIAMTGLSLGGIGVSQFIQDPATSGNYRDLIAAFPIAGGSQSGNDTPQDAVDRNILVKGWQGANDGSSFANPRMENDRDSMNAISAGYYELNTISGGTHSPSTWGKVYNRQHASAVSYDIYAYMNSLLAPPDTTAPTVPSNLTTDFVTKHGIVVSWDASTDTETGISFYSVYLDGVKLSETDQTAFNLGNRLIPGTQYSIEISATDEAGNESAKSAALLVNTIADPAFNQVGGYPNEGLLL